MTKQEKVEDLNVCHSWDEITDNDYITNHSNRGNCLYIISVCVSPLYQNFGFVKKLIDEQKNLGKVKSLQVIYLGARIRNLENI
jgi:hypothetical protein